MKSFYLFSFLFLSVFIFSQEFKWKEVSENSSLLYTVISENSNQEILDSDMVQIIVYQLELGKALFKDDLIEGEDLGALTFQDLKKEFNQDIEIKFGTNIFIEPHVSFCY